MKNEKKSTFLILGISIFSFAFILVKNIEIFKRKKIYDVLYYLQKRKYPEINLIPIKYPITKSNITSSIPRLRTTKTFINALSIRDEINVCWNSSPIHVYTMRNI